MRQFDFYEFTGIIVPGTVLLVATAMCVPGVRALALESEVSIGETSLALIISYGLGHLVQAVGNLMEAVWWWFWGGMPSDWPRNGKRSFLAPEQTDRIDAALKRQGITLAGGFKSLTRASCFAIGRQMYAAVSSAGRASRVDVLNGNYGLNRGLAAALFIVTLMIMLTKNPVPWSTAFFTTLGFLVALCRMHRFGVHYARELFIQFLHLASGTDTRDLDEAQKE